MDGTDEMEGNEGKKGTHSGKEVSATSRVQTLLFEEVLAYCLSTHGPPSMLDRVWPIMPSSYTIDQLLACISPYDTLSDQHSLSAHGSAASFVQIKHVIQTLSGKNNADVATHF